MLLFFVSLVKMPVILWVRWCDPTVPRCASAVYLGVWGSVNGRGAGCISSAVAAAAAAAGFAGDFCFFNWLLRGPGEKSVAV